MCVVHFILIQNIIKLSQLVTLDTILVIYVPLTTKSHCGENQGYTIKKCQKSKIYQDNAPLILIRNHYWLNVFMINPEFLQWHGCYMNTCHSFLILIAIANGYTLLISHDIFTHTSTAHTHTQYSYTQQFTGYFTGMFSFVTWQPFAATK